MKKFMYLDMLKMQKNSLVKIGSSILLGCSFITSSYVQAENLKNIDQQPNVLFILVDDLGWRDLGYMGSEFYETPNIDRLAGQGVRMMAAYADPVSSPTRAALMTGKHSARLGISTFIPGNNHGKPFEPKHPEFKLPPVNDHVPLEEITIAEAFKQAGYVTFFAGKWHLGAEGYWPEEQGFDINVGGHTSGAPRRPGQYFVPYNNPRLKDGPLGEHLPARLGEETSKFIKQNKDNPFFAYLSFYSVHTPIQGRPDLVEKYKKKKQNLGIKDTYIPTKTGASNNPKKPWQRVERSRTSQSNPTYAAMIEAMDQAVGTVIDTLEEENLQDNTIIVFFADNGGLSVNAAPTSNLPLRHGKGSVYEGGVREPCIIVWPGKTDAGRQIEEPIYCTDFYPTLLSMAGLPAKSEQHQDGVDFTELLKGKKFNRAPIFWHFPHPANQGAGNRGAIRDGEWKLIINYFTGKNELFNLQNDLGEQNDLSEKYPEKVQDMNIKFKQWCDQIGAEMPVKK
ncbi:sulfatase [Planctomycetota bacterium]|nr:sulfatase [Planctomycetota bacterium]